MSESSSGRFFEGLVVGGIMGFLFGMLSAPKSGADLRRDIADGSEDLYRTASDSLGDIKSKGQHVISDIQSKGEEVIKKASDSVQGAKDSVTSKLHDLAGQSTQVLVDDVEHEISGA